MPNLYLDLGFNGNYSLILGIIQNKTITKLEKIYYESATSLVSDLVNFFERISGYKLRIFNENPLI
jgi:hypothetical protein